MLSVDFRCFIIIQFSQIYHIIFMKNVKKFSQSVDNLCLTLKDDYAILGVLNTIRGTVDIWRI